MKIGVHLASMITESIVCAADTNREHEIVVATPRANLRTSIGNTRISLPLFAFGVYGNAFFPNAKT
jgi:hypothetical protein